MISIEYQSSENLPCSERIVGDTFGSGQHIFMFDLPRLAGKEGKISWPEEDTVDAFNFSDLPNVWECGW